MHPDFAVALEKCHHVLRVAGQPQLVCSNFERLFRQVASGATGVIDDSTLDQVEKLPSYSDLFRDADVISAGNAALSQLAICKLNGGLGTGMGLNGAKSSLVVKNGLTFNDISARQLLDFRTRLGVQLPLLHMTSFATEAEILAFSQRFPELALAGGAACFNQHMHPRLYADTLLPVEESDPRLNWNPPGHGDLFLALQTSGMLSRLLSAGKRYLFVSNADNLGATVEPAILGFMLLNNIPFLMETALRTEADKKGGHLARRRSDQRLQLRESAQAPADERGDPCPEFQDINRYRYFNSNNIWIDLFALAQVVSSSSGVMELPLIRNSKTLDPSISTSAKVYQLETAMGAAIELFEGAQALSIPRTRFAPVKANSDLLVIRSDAYVLNERGCLVINPAREQSSPPLVSLDTRHYKSISAFEERFVYPPSLLRCTTFKVVGNVRFAAPLSLHGKVSVIDCRSNQTTPVCIPAEVHVLDNQDLTLSDEGYQLDFPS
jgi:UTP--glucose-1-phosphate uridylyltransferase